jgi:hypothetical protein
MCSSDMDPVDIPPPYLNQKADANQLLRLVYTALLNQLITYY